MVIFHGYVSLPEGICSIYWEESAQLTNIFQRGWNHQPIMKCWCLNLWWNSILSFINSNIYNHPFASYVDVYKSTTRLTQTSIQFTSFQPNLANQLGHQHHFPQPSQSIQVWPSLKKLSLGHHRKVTSHQPSDASDPSVAASTRTWSAPSNRGSGATAAGSLLSLWHCRKLHCTWDPWDRGRKLGPTRGVLRYESRGLLWVLLFDMVLLCFMIMYLWTYGFIWFHWIYMV